MLRNVRADELDALITEFWPAALDLSRSSYPTYTDGIKTQTDFSEDVSRSAREAWGEVLVHLWDGAVNGLLVIDEVDDQFVSLRVCLTHAHQPECLAEVLAYLHQKHARKTLWLGFAPENAEMRSFAEQNSFTLLDDTVNWNISLAQWQPAATERPVQRVDDGHYAAFQALWTDESIYWNTERIRAAMERWMLFVTEDGRGAAACLDGEIFGFQYRDGYDEATHRALMTACLNAAAEQGSGYMTYFADREETAVMQSLEFRRVSGYLCYEGKL